MKSQLHLFGLVAIVVVVCACAPTMQGQVKATRTASNDTARVQAMIDAGQVIPAGIFNITYVKGGLVRGSGRDLTVLRQVTPGGNYIAMVQMADHAIVQDLTLDAGAGTAIGGHMNYTTVQRLKLIGGLNGSPGVNPRFTLYYSHQGPGYSIGNQILDVVIEDRVTGDDGFSFSFQKDGVIKNITHHGSRLALYHASGILVDGYDFTPTIYNGTANYGLAVTASDHLTINNFHAPISRPHLMWNPNGGTIGSTTINGMVAEMVRIGDVSGLLVENCTCGLKFAPFLSADLTVSNSHLTRVADLSSKVTVTWINTPLPKLSSPIGARISYIR